MPFESLACDAAAHDVPDDVKVQAFVKPAGDKLHLLVRGALLQKFPLPALDAALLASAMRWLMLILVLGGLAWLARRALRQRRGNEERKATGETRKEKEINPR